MRFAILDGAGNVVNVIVASNPDELSQFGFAGYREVGDEEAVEIYVDPQAQTAEIDAEMATLQERLTALQQQKNALTV